MNQLRARAGGTALLLSIILGLAACGGSSKSSSGAGGTPRDGGTLRVAIAKDVVTLDPALALDNYSQQVVDQVFDTLTTTGQDGSVQPRLATSWKGSGDSTTWDSRSVMESSSTTAAHSAPTTSSGPCSASWMPPRCSRGSTCRW